MPDRPPVAQAAEARWLTLAEALPLLPCGRTFLLEHLKRWPVYAGGPTHRKIGNRYLFYPDDLARLKESFACHASEAAGLALKSSPAKEPPRSTSAAPSPDAQFTKAQAQIRRLLPKRSGPRGKLPSTVIPFTAGSR